MPMSAEAQAGKVQVQWLGQSAFKIITSVGGKGIVIEYLNANPKTPEAYRKLEALGKVDLILVTHGHLDHFLDAPALAKMSSCGAIPNRTRTKPMSAASRAGSSSS
ncbi:MAG TPA: MBL fold metallo-hydrolase [Caldimonas sp.]